MDSDDDNYNADSGNSSSFDEDYQMIEENGADQRQSDSEEYEYEVLETDDVVEHMRECIRDVNTVVQIPDTMTRILLNHFKWDKEKLMEQYFGDQDQEKFFREAHVINPFNQPPPPSGSAGSSSSGSAPTRPKSKRGVNEECEICFTQHSASLMTGLACGHRFCEACWRVYLTTKIMEEGQGQTIACAAHACDILVDDETVIRLITDGRVKLKYQHLITNNFVEVSFLLSQHGKQRSKYSPYMLWPFCISPPVID